jgi:tetratricopeptide (TPR) repeat protein
VSPRCSVVVVAYDIERELPRTLRSLSADYQRGISEADYEVIVVDNGSPTPVTERAFADLSGQFRLIRIDDAPPSPAGAVNRGLQEARGDLVGVMVDGARLATPGLLHLACVASEIHGRSGVATLGWYVGHDHQRFALEAGWSTADEDRLLASIRWPENGYDLFSISTMDESSTHGWFSGIFESNCLFLPKDAWVEIGGFDEAFSEPGGGLVNHDTLRRATEIGDLGWVLLLGEATFHQLHGGIATNARPGVVEASVARWREQYHEIRGRTADGGMLADAVLLGPVPDAMLPLLAGSAETALMGQAVIEARARPPAPLPDPGRERDPFAAQLLDLVRTSALQGRTTEALEFARRARQRTHHTDQTAALLQCIASTTPISHLPRERQARLYLDLGEAAARAGESAEALAHCSEALRLDPGNADVYEALSRLRMPGPGYHDRLRQIHEELNPATYLEIGVFKGQSLTHARPPTIAVGVDPEPRIEEPISVEFHLYTETSGEFFNQRDVRALFGGAGPSLVFIDGLHAFSAVLEDFAHVEAIADPGTLVLLHDMIPFDEITQRPEQVHEFYTGDVWKLLHCFADVRPDLSWFTIRTPPSGLTVVGGLDPTSTVLRDQYDKLVQRYGALCFEDAVETPGPVLENDWPRVVEQLERLRDIGHQGGRALARAEVAPTVSPGHEDESLRRRVRQLEATNTQQGRELTDLRRRARREGTIAAILDPASAQAELERLRSTKLFRWTSPVRRAYSRLRRRGSVT